MTKAKNQELIHEGKAKKIFLGPDEGTLIQHFKDDATAFNGEKKEQISGKGVLNNFISAYLMEQLEKIGVRTHFIERLNMREQLVQAVEIIPIEVLIRNKAAGSLCKRYGAEEGQDLAEPLIEFCLKNDELGDPFLSEQHLYVFDIADPAEIEIIKEVSLRTNDFLRGLFLGVGIELIDFKLEFGRIVGEFTMEIILADEISPDNCRLWDVKTGEKLDKDRFREDLGGVEDAYRDIAKRLGVLPEGGDNVEVLDFAKKEDE